MISIAAVASTDGVRDRLTFFCNPEASFRATGHGEIAVVPNGAHIALPPIGEWMQTAGTPGRRTLR